MAKLPTRQKVTVLVFRRSGPDEILVVQREVKRAVQWAPPSEELEVGESVREAALRVASTLTKGTPVSDQELGVGATYKVNSGPRAGEWTEHYHAVEVPADARAVQGRWSVHYEAKAGVTAGTDAPRVREAITRLRELAKLKP